MINTIIILFAVLIPSICVYFLMNNKYKEQKQITEQTLVNNKNLKLEADEAIERLNDTKKKYELFVNDVKVQMNNKVDEIEELYKKQADERIDKVIKDYEEALKLETEGLEEKIQELDEQLGLKLREVTDKNTLYFTCACDRSKQIPCSVDLSSDENYFTCPECGAVYRIVINASTILMSGITNNPKIANMYDGVEIGGIGRTDV